MTTKNEWRKRLLERRKKITPQRRATAALYLKENWRISGKILSFTTVGSEIDMGPLNALLASEHRLFLLPYRLEELAHFSLPQIDCILVPALGFDRENYRLGYGKGYYDRLLAKMESVRTIGIGFQEQLCEELLPRDPWDLSVQELFLV